MKIKQSKGKYEDKPTINNNKHQEKLKSINYDNKSNKRQIINK